MFTKTAKMYVLKIKEFEGEDFARRVATQCLIDTNGKIVTFIQVLKTSRKLRPLAW